MGYFLFQQNSPTLRTIVLRKKEKISMETDALLCQVKVKWLQQINDQAVFLFACVGGEGG